MDWNKLPKKIKNPSLSELRGIYGNIYSFKRDAKGDIVFRQKDYRAKRDALQEGWRFSWSVKKWRFDQPSIYSLRYINDKIKNRNKNEYKIEYYGGDANIYVREKGFRNPKRIGDKEKVWKPLNPWG